MIQKKTIKGHWLNVQELYDFLSQLHTEARIKYEGIQIINNPDRYQLKGIMLMIASIIEFTRDRIKHGNLRVRP